MRVGRAFLQTFAVQVIQSAASVATGVLIARGLGPFEQGRYALFAAAVGLGSLLAALGQFQGNVLSAAEQPKAGRVLLLRSSLQCLGVVAILIAIQRVGLAVPGALRPSAIRFAFIGVLCVEAFAQVVRGINLGQHDVVAFNASTFLQRATYLGLVVWLWQAGRLALLPISHAWFGAVLISVLFSGALVWRRSAPETMSWTALRTGWARGILRGLRGLVCVGLTLLLIRCDVYMLGPMLGIALVGQVSVATYLAEWLWYVPSILNNLLFAASAADARTRQVDQIARATRSLVALLVPACIVLMFAGKTLVTVLYGSPYAEAGTLFVLLLPGATALALHLVVDSYFAGKGFPAITMWAPGVALALKIALNLVFVPRYGAVGAVCISSLLYVGLLTTKVVALVRETQIPLSVLLRPTWRDITTSLGSATAWVLRRA